MSIRSRITRKRVILTSVAVVVLVAAKAVYSGLGFLRYNKQPAIAGYPV